MKKIILLTQILIFCLAGPLISRELYTVKLKDINNKSFWLPIEKKATVIFYNDYRNLTDNRAFYEEIKKYKGLLSKIDLVVVVNLKPAFYIPDRFIRFMLSDDIREGENPQFCFDDSRRLETKWRLKDCDGKSVILIVSDRRKLKYSHYGKLPTREIKKAVGIIKMLTEE